MVVYLKAEDIVKICKCSKSTANKAKKETIEYSNRNGRRSLSNTVCLARDFAELHGIKFNDIQEALNNVKQ